jgi:hypothetical protein
MSDEIKQTRNQKKRVIDRKDYLTATPQYGVHFGHLLRDYIKAQGKRMTITKAAKLLGLSEPGLKGKFNMPHGGDLYFFIKASILLEHDFFQYPKAIIENKGILPELVAKQSEYDELKAKYETTDKMYKRLLKESEVLYDNIDFLKKKITELEQK